MFDVANRSNVVAAGADLSSFYRTGYNDKGANALRDVSRNLQHSNMALMMGFRMLAFLKRRPLGPAHTRTRAARSSAPPPGSRRSLAQTLKTFACGRAGGLLCALSRFIGIDDIRRMQSDRSTESLRRLSERCRHSSTHSQNSLALNTTAHCVLGALSSSSGRGKRKQQQLKQPQ